MLDRSRVFPNPRFADEHGLIAIGGDYRPELLLEAYMSGIFPWPSDDFPHAWFSPDPRLVLFPDRLHLGRSLRKTIARGRYTTTFDLAFDRVVEGCALVARPDQRGTWISDELARGFGELHHQGRAHSVETWCGERLVGGLYGLALGTMFCGESMFHLETDASKVAFVALVEYLRERGFALIDCQVETPHLLSLGATTIPRDEFLDAVSRCVSLPNQWSD